MQPTTTATASPTGTAPIVRPPKLRPGQTWADWAVEQWSSGQFAGAEYGIRKELEVAPDQPRLLGLLGRVVAEGGRAAEAIPILEKALRAASGALREDIFSLWSDCIRAAGDTAAAGTLLFARLEEAGPSLLPVSTQAIPPALLVPDAESPIGVAGGLDAQSRQALISAQRTCIDVTTGAPDVPLAGVIASIASGQPLEEACGLLLSASSALAPGGRLVLLSPVATERPEIPGLMRRWLELIGLELLAAAPAAWDALLEVTVASNAPFPRFSILQKDSLRPEKAAPAAHRRRIAKGVLYRGMVYNGSGYSDGNVGAILGLHHHRLPMELLPIGPQSDARQILEPGVRATLSQLQRNQVVREQCILYQQCPTHDYDLGIQARYRIGRAVFETDRMPHGWLEKMEQMDEIWVPASFNRDVFASCGVPDSKLHVMLEGLDTSLYTGAIEPIAMPGARGFRFLSIFDWHCRKAPEVLLRAYLSEFKPDEDVTLVLKVFQFTDAAIDLEARLTQFVEREMGMRLENSPPIIFLNGVIPSRQMPRLYASADIFVLPSRGEGWGRPYTEALASGCPVIATRWGGQMDFLHDGNSYLLDIEGVVPAAPDLDAEIFAGHRWAEPSVDHLRQLMRHVFTHHEEARQKAAIGREEVIAQLDWKVLTERWAQRFQEILG